MCWRCFQIPASPWKFVKINHGDGLVFKNFNLFSGTRLMDQNNKKSVHFNDDNNAYDNDDSNNIDNEEKDDD